MTRFLQEGAELLHQQCNVIDRLMTYLDDNLGTLNSKLNSVNFNRFLDVIWETISNVLFGLVQNGIEVGFRNFGGFCLPFEVERQNLNCDVCYRKDDHLHFSLIYMKRCTS